MEVRPRFPSSSMELDEGVRRDGKFSRFDEFGVPITSDALLDGAKVEGTILSCDAVTGVVVGFSMESSRDLCDGDGECLTDDKDDWECDSDCGCRFEGLFVGMNKLSSLLAVRCFGTGLMLMPSATSIQTSSSC